MLYREDCELFEGVVEYCMSIIECWECNVLRCCCEGITFGFAWVLWMGMNGWWRMMMNKQQVFLIIPFTI